MLFLLLEENVDTTVLHEFATLAQKLNYASAARFLNMSQSTLSRHISSLERQLGVRLFTRGTKTELTYEGAILLEEASSVFAAEERIAQRLQGAKRLVRGRVLLLDYYFSRDIKNFMLTAVRRYREMYPGVAFEFRQASDGDNMVEMLDSGRLDVGVLVHCGPEEPVYVEEGIRPYIPLRHERSRMGIYLRNDEVASGEVDSAGNIGIGVLRRLPILLPMRPEYANFRGDMTALCRSHGFDASFRLMEGGQLEDLAMADMRGVAQIVLESDLRDASNPFMLDPSCSFHPIREVSYATPYLLMPRRDDNPVLNSFVDFLEELAEERAHGLASRCPDLRSKKGEEE